MKLKFNKKVMLVVLLMTLVAVNIFPAGGKEMKGPMKAYDVLNVDDGELLRYGQYTGGEKHFDSYFLIRKKTGDDGKLLYYIYSDVILNGSDKVLLEDYTQWPTLYVIDPALGSVIEAEQHYTQDEEFMESISQFGMGDVFYTHYKLHQDKNYVEYITRSFKDGTSMDPENIKETKYRVNLKSNYATWESAVSMYFAPRFMDFLGGGIMYAVVPQFMKEPLPNTYKVVDEEDMTTDAGTFRVVKLEGVLADPFIGKLIGPVVKGGGYWIEKSNRRLVVKIVRNAEGDGTVLENISNIFDK